MQHMDLQSIANDAGYPLEAFMFVQRGLDYTVRREHGEIEDEQPIDDQSRHVSGQTLCLGLRDYAVKQYGLMARSVLRHWHINTSEDFGKIVFAMVDAGLMHKTDDDTIDDFRNAIDFAQAFGRSLVLSGKSV